MSSLVISGDTSGSVTLQAPAVAGTTTLTLPATTATLATLTTPSFATTIGVGGATPSASGAGITFPATQSASSDANTLDDYEEGSWTPQLFQGATQITSPTSAVGYYVKVGKMLWIGAYFVKTSGAPSASGDFQIRNLPFQVLAGEGTTATQATYMGVNGTGSTQSARFQANSSSALTLYGEYGSTSWTTSYIEMGFSGCLRTDS